MRHRNPVLLLMSLLALAIPSLLGGVRPARADAPPAYDGKPGTESGQQCVNPRDGAVMVWVPAGGFTMGSKDDDKDASANEKPQRQVTLDGYWIDKNLVTAAQYRKFCDDTGRRMPDPPDWGWKDDHPIVNVSWDDSKAYADWAGASLPTEAQWEKAARGTDGRKYPWGNRFDRGRLWCSQHAVGDAGRTAPVGSFPKGASPYGALDMAGNVWEWCADWYSPDYHGAPTNNPTGPATGEYRVVRGGSWIGDGDDEIGFGCAERGGNGVEPDIRIYNYGFRCVVRAGG